MNRLEDPVHYAIADYLRVALPPDWIWQTIDNAAKRSKAAQKDLKRKGNKSGFPDIIIMPRCEFYAGGESVWRVLFIEVKAPRGYPSKAQREMHHRLMDAGYEVCVARSVEDVERWLRACGVPLRASTGAK